MDDNQKTILNKERDVGVLLLNNPPENYLEQPEFTGTEKLRDFVNSGIKALVIGSTGRHLSAGADLKIMRNSIKNINRFKNEMTEGSRLLNYVDELEIPVIAAISGVCFGAGLEIALACDIRICEEDSMFAFPEINHGLFPGLGGTQRLVRLAGRAVALELVLGGDMISAEKAKELHIVDEVVHKKKANDFAVELAKKLTDNRQLKVIKAVMLSIRNHEKLPVEEAIKKDAEMFAQLAKEALGDEIPAND